MTGLFETCTFKICSFRAGTASIRYFAIMNWHTASMVILLAFLTAGRFSAIAKGVIFCQ
jgi:hypothetical protein